MVKQQPSSEEQSLVEHLGELRKRIIWVLVILVLTMILGFVVADPVITYLESMSPLQGESLKALSPWDPIRIYMQVSFVIGFAITLPFLLLQLWLFVKPGLRPYEQKAAVKYIPLAVLLFLIGVAFSYFVVFRMALTFTTSMAKHLELDQMYGIAQYFGFMFNIVLPVSILFELPIVVMFLTAIRLLNPKRLGKFRRFAYFILMILSAIVTPPDVLSAMIVMVPLIVLYEVSVILSGMIYRKQLAKDRAWEAEYGTK